jgi:hypothetical protein
MNKDLYHKKQYGGVRFYSCVKLPVITSVINTKPEMINSDFTLNVYMITSRGTKNIIGDFIHELIEWEDV